MIDYLRYFDKLRQVETFQSRIGFESFALANSKNRCWLILELEEMSNSKVIVEKHEEVTRVTINEEGEWSLLMNDVDGACVHVQCSGSVSCCVCEGDDGFAYSMRSLNPKIDADWSSEKQ